MFETEPLKGDELSEENLRRLEASWVLAEGASYELSPEAQECISQWHTDCRRLLATVRALLQAPR